MWTSFAIGWSAGWRFPLQKNDTSGIASSSLQPSSRSHFFSLSVLSEANWNSTVWELRRPSPTAIPSCFCGHRTVSYRPSARAWVSPLAPWIVTVGGGSRRSREWIWDPLDGQRRNWGNTRRQTDSILEPQTAIETSISFWLRLGKAKMRFISCAPCQTRRFLSSDQSLPPADLAFGFARADPGCSLPSGPPPPPHRSTTAPGCVHSAKHQRRGSRRNTWRATKRLARPQRLPRENDPATTGSFGWNWARSAGGKMRRRGSCCFPV